MSIDFWLPGTDKTMWFGKIVEHTGILPETRIASSSRTSSMVTSVLMSVDQFYISISIHTGNPSSVSSGPRICDNGDSDDDGSEVDVFALHSPALAPTDHGWSCLGWSTSYSYHGSSKQTLGGEGTAHYMINSVWKLHPCPTKQCRCKSFMWEYVSIKM